MRKWEIRELREIEIRDRQHTVFPGEKKKVGREPVRCQVWLQTNGNKKEGTKPFRYSLGGQVLGDKRKGQMSIVSWPCTSSTIWSRSLASTSYVEGGGMFCPHGNTYPSNAIPTRLPLGSEDDEVRGARVSCVCASGWYRTGACEVYP